MLQEVNKKPSFNPGEGKTRRVYVSNIADALNWLALNHTSEHTQSVAKDLNDLRNYVIKVDHKLKKKWNTLSSSHQVRDLPPWL